MGKAPKKTVTHLRLHSLAMELNMVVWLDQQLGSAGTGTTRMDIKTPTVC